MASTRSTMTYVELPRVVIVHSTCPSLQYQPAFKFAHVRLLRAYPDIPFVLVAQCKPVTRSPECCEGMPYIGKCLACSSVPVDCPPYLRELASLGLWVDDMGRLDGCSPFCNFIYTNASFRLILHPRFFNLPFSF